MPNMPKKNKMHQWAAWGYACYWAGYFAKSSAQTHHFVEFERARPKPDSSQLKWQPIKSKGNEYKFISSHTNMQYFQVPLFGPCWVLLGWVGLTQPYNKHT